MGTLEALVDRPEWFWLERWLSLAQYERSGTEWNS